MADKNVVDIYIKGHEKDVLRAIDRVKAALQSIRNTTAKVTVDVDDGALSRLRAELAAIRNATVRARVEADTTELTRLRQQLATLRDRTVRVDVDLDSAGALAGLSALDAARGNVTVNLDLDTSTAAAELAAFIAAVPRNVTINLDLDLATAAAELAAFRLAMVGLGNVGNGFGPGSAASGIRSMGSAASMAAPAIAAAAVALAPLVGAAAGAGVFAVAAGLGAVTAAAGALSVGVGGAFAAIPIAAAATSQKVQDHFTFMKDNVVNTMKEIAEPVQEPLVNLATAVGAAFHQIRPSLDVVTAGAARLVDELSGEMPAIAAEVGPAMEKAFGAAEPHIKNLIGNIPSYIQAFGNFADKLGDPAIVAGAQRVFGMIPGIIDGAGDSIVSMANGFQNVMGYLDSGALDGFTSGIGSFIDELSGADWSGTIDGISNLANSFGDLIGSVEGESVTGFLEGMTSDLTKFSDAAKTVGDIGSGIGDFLQGIGDSAVNFGEVSGLNSFGDQINGFLDSIGLIEWDGPEINANPRVNGDLSSVTPMFDNILNALQPVDLPPVPQPVVPVFDALTAPPALPPVEQPLIPGILPVPNTPAPLQIPLEPGPLPPPAAPPAPVVIETQAELTNIAQPDIPPLKVPVQYDTAGLGMLTIQPPPPVKVPVDIDTAGANVDLSAQGAAAGASFAAGLASQAGAVAAAAANLGAVAAANKGHYKGRKGIAADRIMLIPHGKAMVAGFVQGLGAMDREVISQASALARTAQQSFDDELVPAIGLSGGMDISQTVHVVVEAGLMADPVKIGREVKSVLGAYASAVGQNGKSISV